MWKTTGLRRAVIQYLGAVAFFVEVQAYRHEARQDITPPPILTWIGIRTLEAATCEPITFTWFYNGPSDTLKLIVTNNGVSQSQSGDSDSGFVAPPSTSLKSITIGNIDPSSAEFTWGKANIPAGNYVINASIPTRSFSSVSDPFFISEGNDKSCLSSAVTSSSSIRSSTAGSSTPTSSSAVALPVSGSSSNSPMIGAIVGACVGAVAVVAAAFLFWLCQRRRRLARANGSTSSHSAHRFNGLSSVDSRTAPPAKEASRSRHRPHNSSFGTAVINGSDEGVGAEKESFYSNINSPNSFSHDAPLSSLPVLSHQPMSPIDLPRGKESFDSTTYPPTSPNSAHRNSGHFGALGHVSTPSHSTASHHEPSRSRNETSSDVNKKANRQSLGRKRKPVPAYDGNDAVAKRPQPSQLSISPTVPQTAQSPFSPSPSPIPDSTSTSPASSNLGHYTTRNRSVADVSHPELAHKSSFGPGAQPMHYLIPDMPIPQRS